MIRNLVLDRDLAGIMSDGQNTIDAAMHALHLYFREHVYKTSKRKFIHPTAIDDDVCQILTAAIVRDEPHLKSVFKVTIERNDPDEYVADVFIGVDEVHIHMVEAQPGSRLCH